VSYQNGRDRESVLCVCIVWRDRHLKGGMTSVADVSLPDWVTII